MHRALGCVELGLAQLAVLVGVGGSEPGITMLLHAQLAVGLVQVTVLVEVEPVEAQPGAGSALASSRLMRPSLLTSSLALSPPWPRRPCCQRGSSSRELAVLVLVQLVELRGQARIGAASLRSITPSPLVSSLAGAAPAWPGCRRPARFRKRRCPAAGPAAGGTDHEVTPGDGNSVGVITSPSGTTTPGRDVG